MSPSPLSAPVSSLHMYICWLCCLLLTCACLLLAILSIFWHALAACRLALHIPCLLLTFICIYALHIIWRSGGGWDVSVSSLVHSFPADNIFGALPLIVG